MPYITRQDDPACRATTASRLRDIGFFALAAASVASAVTATAQTMEQPESPRASTHFRSAGCDTLVQGPGPEVTHIKRDYLIMAGRHSTRYAYFADAQCEHPLFTFNLSGRVVNGAPVQGVPGAVASDVYFDRVLLTPESPDGLKVLASCKAQPWEVGVQQDVTTQGCLAIKPKASCGIDHDIIRIADGVLTPGFRTADMCTSAGRPIRLQSRGAALVK